MRIFGLSLFIFSTLLTSCGESNTETFDLKTFPENWVRLTEKDGKFIVFNSCDMGNLLLTISKKENNFELLLHGEQEDDEYEILESYKNRDTIFMITKLKNLEDKQLFKFVWVDETKGLARWITTYSSGYSSDNIFVLIEKQTDFEKVDQPCKECWGDECDEIEPDITIVDKPIEKIRKVFEAYIQNEESTDSPDNKELMTKSIQSLDLVKNPKDLELLINVWMYYDPTDFPSRNLVYNVLKKNAQISINAVNDRINNKKEWENAESEPYSELDYLLKNLEKE